MAIPKEHRALPFWKVLARAWTNLPLRLKGFVVVSLPVAALLLSAALTGLADRQKNGAEAAVRHRLEVRTQIRQVSTLAAGAHAAVLGYGLTRQEEWLQPLDAFRRNVNHELSLLESLVQDSPEQLRRLTEVRRDIRDWLDVAAESRKLYERSDARASAIPSGLPEQGKRLTDQIHNECEAMLKAEDDLLEQRVASNRPRDSAVRAIIGASLLVCLGGLLLAFLLTNNEIRRIQELELSANRLEQDLPPVLPSEGKDELGRLGKALGNAATILAERSQNLKLALEGAQVLIWELDVQLGCIRYQLGSEVLRNAHYPPELLPKTVDEWLAVVHPEDRIRMAAELSQALAREGSYQFEYRITVPGSGVICVLAKGQRRFAEEGKRDRLQGVLLDITARKHAEEQIERQARELEHSRAELQQQTRILQSVLDSMGDGVAVADENAKFLVFNPAGKQILGKGAFGGEAHDWSEHYGLFLPDMVSRYPPDEIPLIRAIRGESVDSAELFVRNAGLPEGAWVSATARPLKAENGDFRGGVVVFRDITPEKQASEQLKLAKLEAEQANLAKSEFLSRMSHELRTPLNSILGFAQLLEMAELEPDQADNVQHVLRGGRHLLDLINEILDLARIEAGRLGLSPEPVRMREALRDALDVVRPLAVQQNIHLSADVAVRCNHHVLADRQRLKQVLLNLLANAVKFNREGGSVILSCEEVAENRLRIEIADTGIGISPDGIGKLFHPFERLTSDQAGISGTGLGLVLSKRLVEAMGGSIGVDSTVGVGSRFHIELGILEHPADRLKDEETLAAASAGGDPAFWQGTVLYIEDNLSNLRLMERIVAPYPGVRLLAAMQAKLGLELAKAHAPDWILLDVHLPDLPGDEVLRRLREDPETRQIPVTVVSADATPGQVRRLTNAGARDYLTKPFDVKQLIRLLEATLRHGTPGSESKVIAHAERDRSE